MESFLHLGLNMAQYPAAAWLKMFLHYLRRSGCCRRRHLETLDVSSPSEAKWEISIALPSGRSQSWSLRQTSTVGHLRTRAEAFCGQRFLRLVTAEGRILTDPEDDLQVAGLKDGDTITAVRVEPKVAATLGAFALWCPEGDGIELRAWGCPEYGGDSSTVQDQLRHVKQVQATWFAFAAILADGSLVTWGDPSKGGDSSRVQDQLINVQQICGTHSAFAGILADGTVVTWGDPK